jgi:hypothetical protein
MRISREDETLGPWVAYDPAQQIHDATHPLPGYRRGYYRSARNKEVQGNCGIKQRASGEPLAARWHAILLAPADKPSSLVLAR